MATFTYDEATNKEDLSDIIVNMSPSDTPVTSMIGRTKAKATYHEFPEDELLPADPDNAVPEGYTFAPKPVQGRARTGNYTQIFVKEFTVTETQQVVDKTGVSDEKAYQMKKAMKQIGKDLEVAILNNTITGISSEQVDFQTAITTKSGKRKFGKKGTAGTVDMSLADAYQGGGVKPSTGTARKLSGLQDLIYTHNYTGGPTLDNVAQALQDTWTDGGNPSKLVVSPAHKRILSMWTETGQSRLTINRNANDNKLTEAIDVYQTDFGTIEIVASRYLIAQTATDPVTGKVLNYDLSGVSFVLDPSYLKLAWLRPFKKVDLPKLADSTAHAIIGEVTLENRGEKGQAIIRGTRTVSSGSDSVSGGSDSVSGGDSVTVVGGTGGDTVSAGTGGTGGTAGSGGN